MQILLIDSKKTNIKLHSVLTNTIYVYNKMFIIIICKRTSSLLLLSSLWFGVPGLDEA